MEINAVKREKFGKDVESLRGEGLVPAVVYGKGFENLSISLNLKDFRKVYKEAGHSSVVDLKVEGVKETLKVLVTHIQQEPINNEIIHADFHKIDLKEKVSAGIPIEFTGESSVVKTGEGILLILLNEIEVEALPLDLPHKISVDISNLLKVGDAITIKDLPIDYSKVKVVQHREEDLVVKIDYAVQLEKEEEVKTVEEVEVLKEKPAEEGAETDSKTKEPVEPKEDKKK